MPDELSRFMVRPQAVNHQDPGASPASERQCSQISVPSRRVLPARIGRTQPEEDPTGQLIMRGERSIVLDDHMNVAEMPAIATFIGLAGCWDGYCGPATPPPQPRQDAS